ncbi:phage tail protein [Paenibacillus daejeonensis]|uniref:phage tail-collar fiber domain-containing protein n=1 Tax=Paenibacillus daejeonensis TaxID=135193 RepID=UPI00035C49C5|nr:phage tail protein [Paenibacillus daejeonensis]
MANFTNIQITNRGRALQAKAQAGAQLVFTRFRIGSGQMSGQQIADMTNLIQPVMWLTLNKSQPSSTGRHTIGAPFTNTGVTTGFYFREWGLFAQDPDIGEILYCYGNVGAGAEYIPAGGGSEIIEQQLDMIVIIGNATTVNAVIDESLAFVSLRDFQQGMETKVDKVAGKKLSTEDYTTAEKTKLGGIATGAQVNTVTSVAGKTGAVALVKADVGLGNVDNVQQAPLTHVGAGGPAHAAATASVAGFLSAADKDKLDKSTSSSTANSLMQRDANGQTNVSAPTANSHVARKQDVDAVSTTVNQIGDYIQAQYILAGGGSILWNNLHFTWSARFIVLPMDKAINPAGYLNIELPPAGTVIPGIGSSASVTVVADLGIPLNPTDWHTLYAVHTPGSITATLMIADYAALTAGMITPNMILIAAINADTFALKLGTGQVMPSGTSIVNGNPSVDSTRVVQNPSHRFVSDNEKTTWNAKAGTSVVTTNGNGLMSAGDKVKLDGVAAGANNYVHPATHPASIITQDANNRFVSDAEKAAWNAGAINVDQDLRTTASPTFVSTTFSQPSGTPPFSVDSTTVIPSLNADMLDGVHASSFARLASPTFTGNPTGPTPVAGTNSTRLATTAFVQSAVAAIPPPAPKFSIVILQEGDEDRAIGANVLYNILTGMFGTPTVHGDSAAFMSTNGFNIPRAGRYMISGYVTLNGTWAVNDTITIELDSGFEGGISAMPKLVNFVVPYDGMRTYVLFFSRIVSTNPLGGRRILLRSPKACTMVANIQGRNNRLEIAEL